ncbi:MAG: multiheme c-type cytochrome [Anaerolineaceae bacterium]
MTEMRNSVRPVRTLVIGLISVIIVIAAVLVIMIISRAGQPREGARVDALAQSSDGCVTCHRSSTPGIVSQYGHSIMAAANVTCRDCHEVDRNYPGAVEHEGDFVLRSPTSARCEKCHQSETAQYNQSRHGLPAFVAVSGAQNLPPDLLTQYKSIPEGQFTPDKSRNALAVIEGEGITRFACETCHDVGKPAEDGSIGQCQKCHLRHEFSLEQVRKPETCNACHIGPDHPQWEIYVESPHGIAYHTGGYRWNWEAAPGSLTVEDFPASTCSTCHFSGFGTAGTTHDVGDRLSWYLFAPISERRPAWQDNLVRMQGVCLECHNKEFIDTFYKDADIATLRVNELVVESNDIMKPLVDGNLVTAEAFDQPIDYTYFELWHHWGRTAKFGTWMQGPDYTQWHGAYEMVKGLAELREMAEELLKPAAEPK